MVNQKVNLGRRPMSARPDIAILKDRYFFLKNPSKKITKNSTSFSNNCRRNIDQSSNENNTLKWSLFGYYLKDSLHKHKQKKNKNVKQNHYHVAGR